MPSSNKNGLAEAARRERATNIINIHDGGKFIMEPTITTTTTITNSVVGAHMENITHVIQQLPPQLAQLRTALEELYQNAKPVLIELKKTQPAKAEKAAKRLDQFVEAAKKQKPAKDFLQVTSKGLLDAAKTVAAMAGKRLI